MYTGNYKKGVIFRTENQIKKHREQMTLKELDLIRKIWLEIPPETLQYSSHYISKMGTAANDLIDKLYKEGLQENIIEVNLTLYHHNYELRVLLRSLNPVLIKMKDCRTEKWSIETCNLCVVLSLTHHKVITAYWNKINDSHNSIDWTRYNQTLNIEQSYYERRPIY